MRDQPSDRRAARGGSRRGCNSGGTAFYASTPRKNLPRHRTEPACPAVGRHIPGGGSRHVRRLVPHGPSLPSWASDQQFLSRQARQRQAAANLVECGARLRDVAAALGIPLALRHLKPGVAHLVSDVLNQHPELLQWVPKTTPAARIWLLSVDFAHRRAGVDYARWVARHLSEIPGRLNQVAHVVSDLSDWVRANAAGGGAQFVTRAFRPAMGFKAAIKASHDWHEAVASHMDGADGLALPPPWFPAAKQGAFEIIPVTTAADLYREGHVMHHCVATYADCVRGGASYVFSVRREGKGVATISLVRDGGRILIDQVRGLCNAAPPKAVMAAVRQWLRTQPAMAAIIQRQHEEWCASQTRQHPTARA